MAVPPQRHESERHGSMESILSWACLSSTGLPPTCQALLCQSCWGGLCPLLLPLLSGWAAFQGPHRRSRAHSSQFSAWLTSLFTGPSGPPGLQKWQDVLIWLSCNPVSMNYVPFATDDTKADPLGWCDTSVSRECRCRPVGGTAGSQSPSIFGVFSVRFMLLHIPISGDAVLPVHNSSVWPRKGQPQTRSLASAAGVQPLTSGPRFCRCYEPLTQKVQTQSSGH